MKGSGLLQLAQHWKSVVPTPKTSIMSDEARVFARILAGSMRGRVTLSSILLRDAEKQDMMTEYQKGLIQALRNRRQTMVKGGARAVKKRSWTCRMTKLQSLI